MIITASVTFVTIVWLRPLSVALSEVKELHCHQGHTCWATIIIITSTEENMDPCTSVSVTSCV